jgi:hypothetical protein
MIRYDYEHTLNEGEQLYSKKQAHIDGTKKSGDVGSKEGGLIVAAPPPTSEATSRAAPLLIGIETAPTAGSEPAAARHEAAVHDNRDLR